MNEPKVKLSYRLKGTTGWMEHELTADEYYEPEEGGRTWDSVPLHLHANEYLEVKPSQLEQTVLRIHDGAGGLRCTVREIFWNEGRNRLIQRIDDDGMLLILEIRTGTCPEMFRTSRPGPNKGCHASSGGRRSRVHWRSTRIPKCFGGA